MNQSDKHLIQINPNIVIEMTEEELRYYIFLTQLAKGGTF
jgi:hypothetical protein